MLHFVLLAIHLGEEFRFDAPAGFVLRVTSSLGAHSVNLVNEDGAWGVSAGLCPCHEKTNIDMR